MTIGYCYVALHPMYMFIIYLTFSSSSKPKLMYLKQ